MSKMAVNGLRIAHNANFKKQSIEKHKSSKENLMEGSSVPWPSFSLFMSFVCSYMKMYVD